MATQNMTDVQVAQVAVSLGGFQVGGKELKFKPYRHGMRHEDATLSMRWGRKRLGTIQPPARQQGGNVWWLSEQLQRAITERVDQANELGAQIKVSTLAQIWSDPRQALIDVASVFDEIDAVGALA